METNTTEPPNVAGAVATTAPATLDDLYALISRAERAEHDHAASIYRKVLGVETVLRLLIGAAPMTSKMRKQLAVGLDAAGIDPREWVT